MGKQHNRVDYSLLLGDLLCPSTPPDELQGEYTIVSGNHVYCFGIVDALDSYHCGWWCQGMLIGSVLRLSCGDPSSITAVTPAQYAERFQKFLIEEVLDLNMQEVLDRGDQEPNVLSQGCKAEQSDRGKSSSMIDGASGEGGDLEEAFPRLIHGLLE